MCEPQVSGNTYRVCDNRGGRHRRDFYDANQADILEQPQSDTHYYKTKIKMHSHAGGDRPATPRPAGQLDVRDTSEFVSHISTDLKAAQG